MLFSQQQPKSCLKLDVTLSVSWLGSRTGWFDGLNNDPPDFHQPPIQRYGVRTDFIARIWHLVQKIYICWSFVWYFVFLSIASATLSSLLYFRFIFAPFLRCRTGFPFFLSLVQFYWIFPLPEASRLIVSIHPSIHSFIAFRNEIMITQISALLLGAVALTSALPATVEKRVVTQLNQAAFQEAQQRDATATRAFSSVEIKVSHPSHSSNID